MARRPLTDQEVFAYRQDGYILVRRIFDSGEVDRLRRTAKEHRALDGHAFGRANGEGGKVRLSLWNRPGDTLYGMFARCKSMAASAEKLLGGEVYAYRSKTIVKDAMVGDARTCRRDCDYWCQDGVLFPLLCSMFLAVGAAARENGCMRVIRRSRKLGRIDHVLAGDQPGADTERVNEVLKRPGLVYVEMDPGDALFFDCNLLRGSGRNRSENPRWSMTCCYNAGRKDPYKESHHPRCAPLRKVPDSAIKQAGLRRLADTTADVAWLADDWDRSARTLGKKS